MDRAPQIRHLAAAALRDALTAAQAGDLPTALSHLMSIDTASWEQIKTRLAELGPLWTATLAPLNPGEHA